jgi:hypothetical protein
MSDAGTMVANRITREASAMGTLGSDMVGGKREAFVSGHAKRKEEQSEYMQTVH